MLCACVVATAFLVACEGGRTEPPGQAAAVGVRDVRIVVDAPSSRAAEEEGVDLDAAVGAVASDVDRRIDLPITTVRVRVRPERVIHAIGLGGFTYATGDVVIFLDPGHHDFATALRTWLPPIVAHELHHATRIVDGPGYGDSLVEDIVTEGLADAFSLEVYPGTPEPPWTDALPPRSVCRWWQRARGVPRRGYDHGEWFFGRSDVPLWAGYTIGAALIRAYLSHHPSESAASLFDDRANRIVRGAFFCRGR